jgi:hypothetical protein
MLDREPPRLSGERERRLAVAPRSPVPELRVFF